MAETVQAVPEFDQDRVIERVVLRDGQNAVQLMLAEKTDRPLLGKVVAGLSGTTLVLIVFPGDVEHSKAYVDEIRAMKGEGIIPPKWEVTCYGGASFLVNCDVDPWVPFWQNSSTTVGNGLPENIMARAESTVRRLLVEEQSCRMAA